MPGDDVDDWKLGAPCKEYPPSTFWPRDDEPWNELRAKAVCAGCSVRSTCLDAALQRHEVGIWGGLNEKEREKVRRERRRVDRARAKPNEPRRVTQADVAVEAGTSQAVTSLVLQGKTESVRADTARRVVDAAKRLGYER